MHYSTFALVRDIWGYIKPYKWRFFQGTLFRIVSEIVWLYPAYGVAAIINYLSHYSKGQSLQPIFVIAAYWAAAVLINHRLRF